MNSSTKKNLAMSGLRFPPDVTPQKKAGPNGETCDCIDKMQKVLETRDAALDLATHLVSGLRCVQIKICKANPDKRGRLSMVLTPNFCPFCGVSARS